MQFHTDDDLDDIKDDGHHHDPNDEDGINDGVGVGSCHASTGCLNILSTWQRNSLAKKRIGSDVLSDP